MCFSSCFHFPSAAPKCTCCICSCAYCGSWGKRGEKERCVTEELWRSSHQRRWQRDTQKAFKFTSLFLPVLILDYTTSKSEHVAPHCTLLLVSPSILCPFIHLFTWANTDLPHWIHSQVLISADNCFNSKALLILLFKGRNRRARPPGCCTKTKGTDAHLRWR